MDPTIIAAGATSLLVPFLRRSLEEFAGEAGKRAWASAESMARRLRQSQTGSDADELEQLKHDPDALERNLIRRLENDPKLADYLNDVLAKLKSTAPNLRIVQNVVSAESVVAARIGTVGRGRHVSVDQWVDGAGDVTGAIIDRLE